MIDTLKNIIRFSKYKSIAGLMLAMAVLAVCVLLSNLGGGVVFAAAFVVLGCVKLDIKNTAGRYLTVFTGGIIAVVATWYISVAMLDAFEQISVTWDKLLLNYLCIIITCLLIFVATANWKLSVVVATFLLVTLSTVNAFIYQFRGKELGPMDILSARTALNVAGKYEVIITRRMLYGWLSWLLVAFGQFSLPGLNEISKMKSRICVLIIEIILIMTLWLASADIRIMTWNKDGTLINGYYLNFFLGMRDFAADKPENYNAGTAAVRAGEYEGAAAVTERESQPNVIVIMNESFADFGVFKEELRKNIPVTPFIDSLNENTVRGYALASVFGGNTANSEYEFLTGHSMSLLPTDSVPYQQYIRGNIFGLPWVMSSYGYKTFATHPYYASGWSRDVIYPYLGFDKSTFIEDYPSQQLVRGYVSDREMLEYVMQSIEAEDKPLFLFGIAMQNHGGYASEEEEYPTTVRLEGYAGEYPHTEEYLSLINETDSAMEYFLTALKDYDEETVVLFFGDHFPQVEDEIFDILNGGEIDTLPERMLKFKVPFIIWANYDIPEKTVECTSLNYLSGYLLEAAGLELTPYHRYLADLEKDIPAMNARGYYSLEKNEFISYDEAPENEAERLNEYKIIQYNNIFDSKNRNKMFFGQYITAE